MIFIKISSILYIVFNLISLSKKPIFEKYQLLDFTIHKEMTTQDYIYI